MKYFQMIPLIFVLVLTVSNVSMLNASYEKTNNLVFSVNDMPFNHPFRYWVAKWFDWFLSLPNIHTTNNESLSHPRDNYSPEKCSWNQDKGSPVWMLPDGPDRNDLSTIEIRDCVIPAGKALLVQIVGSNCSPNEGYKTDQELIDCASWILNEATFSASVDGIEVMNTNKNPSDREKYYVQPFFTNISYGKNNYYDDPEGIVRGTEAGHFFFVKPLPTGSHIVKYQESVINALDSTGNDRRISGLEYHLTVKNESQN